MRIAKIEIYFPIEIELTTERQKGLDKFLRGVCFDACPEGKVMWPSGYGFDIFDYPLTVEEEDNWVEKPTDWSTYQISCSIKDK